MRCNGSNGLVTIWQKVFRVDMTDALKSMQLEIVTFTQELAPDFYRINAEWIESMFVMEDSDRKVLENPQSEIIDRGGVILFVKALDIGIIGACALRKEAEGVFELTKMGVSSNVQGRKAGDFLLQHMIERAVSMHAKTLYLLTNWDCAAAIHLYEKHGFVHDVAIMQRYGGSYDRCNVAMSFPMS